MRVFVNGCFDILHIGHIKLLQFAAGFGSVTVGLNSDESVAALKPGRPINHYEDRCSMLLALRYVCDVRMIPDLDPVHTLNMLYRMGIGPQIVVKGGEYQYAYLPERKIVEENGGEFAFFRTIPGYSTTRFIQCLRS